MSVQVENLEHNMAKLTIEVPAEEFEKAVQRVYMKQKNSISIQGFRKGKVPRSVVEKIYGAGVFYEDAVNQLLPDNYGKAAEESGLDIVSMPTIDVVQMEKGKEFIFTAEVALRPDVELGKYTGVTVTKIDCSVTEEEAEKEIESERERNARTVSVEGRPVQDGDTVVIDFDGYVDGEPFEGGKAENHSLVIGSHSFIDTFEDQLIGKNAGEELDVNVTFPEEYHAADLAGKPAVFKVKIHEIKAKELPELDDEFAQDVSEFDTFAEYKESVIKRIAERKEAAAKRDKEDEAVAKIVDKSRMDIPEAMIMTHVQRMIDEFAHRIGQSGLSVEQYLQFSGTTMEALQEQMRPDALKNIQNTLVLLKIAETENLEAEEEEVDQEIADMAALYNMEVEKAKSLLRAEDIVSIKEDIMMHKALDFVMSSVKERAKAKTKVKKDKDAEKATESEE